MRVSDIVLLLGFAAQFDGRIQVDTLKAEAWQTTLSVHIPYEFARDAISKHYAISGEVVAPHHLNSAWKSYNKEQYEKSRSQSARLELEALDARKASPEAVAQYTKTIREQLQQKRVNENEGNQLTN